MTGLFLYCRRETIQILLTEPTGVFYRQFVTLLAAHKVRFPEHSYIESIIAIMQFLTMDNSVAFLPEYAVEPQIRAGSLCELSVDVPEQYFYSQVLFSKQKTVAPYMLELVRLIRAARPEND